MLKSYPNLTLRNHTYYVRIHVPNHLIRIAKRKNFYYSLHTKEYYEAIHKVREAAYKIDLLIRSYERKFQDMLKCHLKSTDQTKLIFTYTEVQHIFVMWWAGLLRKIEKDEDKIRSGQKTFKDYCFYKPIEMDEVDRIVYPYDNDMYTDDMDDPIRNEYVLIKDVYDGDKKRTPEEELISNPSQEVKYTQLYDFILAVLNKDIKEGKVDREFIDILQDDPYAIKYVDRPNQLEIVGKDGKTLQDIIDQQENEEDEYDISDSLYSLAMIEDKMRESEKTLRNLLNDIHNDTTTRKSIYFSNIIEVAKNLNNNHLTEINLKTPVFDYVKYLKKWEEVQKVKKVALKTLTVYKKRISTIIELVGKKGIDKISQKDIDELELKLMKLPKHIEQNMSALDAVKKFGDDERVRKISGPTVIQYIKTFSTFAEFLKDQEII